MIWPARRPDAAASFLFPFHSSAIDRKVAIVTVDTFKQEIAESVRAYERYIVCLNKTPEECEAARGSLMNKAIKAYESRGPQLRHGIALDKQCTIILSQSETDRPLCGIYFNLFSPYQKKTPPLLTEPGGRRPESK